MVLKVKKLQQCTVRAEYFLISVLTGEFEGGGEGKKYHRYAAAFGISPRWKQTAFFCCQILLKLLY